MTKTWKCTICGSTWLDSQVLEDPDTGELVCGDIMCGGLVEKEHKATRKQQLKEKEARYVEDL